MPKPPRNTFRVEGLIRPARHVPAALGGGVQVPHRDDGVVYDGAPVFQQVIQVIAQPGAFHYVRGVGVPHVPLQTRVAIRAHAPLTLRNCSPTSRLDADAHEEAIACAVGYDNNAYVLL